MHSPFPWRTHPLQSNSVFDADGRRIINSNMTVDVVTAEDNAALIASIPQLVEALKFYRDAWRAQVKGTSAEWLPKEELLEDFGRKATEALKAAKLNGWTNE